MNVLYKLKAKRFFKEEVFNCFSWTMEYNIGREMSINLVAYRLLVFFKILSLVEW